MFIFLHRVGQDELSQSIMKSQLEKCIQNIFKIRLYRIRR